MYSYLLNLLDPLLLVFRWFFVSFSKPQKSWKLRDFGGVVLAQLTWRVGVPIFAQWSCAENVRKRGARKISNSCVGKVFRLRTFYGEWGIYPSGDISQHGMKKNCTTLASNEGTYFQLCPCMGMVSKLRHDHRLYLIYQGFVGQTAHAITGALGLAWPC